MKPSTPWAALTVMMALWASNAAADCNGAPDPCRLDTGTYHIVLPQGVTGPVPAIFILHGFGGEGAATIRNPNTVAHMLARGYAVIAPDGQPRGNGQGRSWDFHPDRPATRDETAFLIAVADDAAAKYGLKRDDMLLAGFSIGGSMTSYVACQTPQAFAAYAPVAGSFWRPHPDRCAGPVRLLHTHGTADQTVPLTGRTVRPGFTQGDVFAAMDIWRLTNGCAAAKADRTDQHDIYDIQRWTDCQRGTDLQFAVHGGGHIIPESWAQMAVDWFETR